MLRSRPQTGQSPAQSSRQRILSGSSRTSASRAQADRSSWSFATVRRAQLVRLRALGLILASRDLDVDHGVGQAPVAGAVQPSLEAQLEDRAALGTADDELGRRLVGHGQIALTAERDRLERDLLLVSVLLPRPQAQCCAG